jgi:hypothetical protein
MALLKAAPNLSLDFPSNFKQTKKAFGFPKALNLLAGVCKSKQTLNN